MSMSSISTVPTPSTSHSQIFEDARQGKFRANRPSDGVTKRNPYEFENSDSEGEQLMAAPSHGYDFQFCFQDFSQADNM